MIKLNYPFYGGNKGKSFIIDTQISINTFNKDGFEINENNNNQYLEILN